MMRLLLCGLLCVALSSALAQEIDPNAPATREDIERYLAITRSRDMMQKTLAAMLGPMHEMIHEQYLRNKDKLPAGFEQREISEMDEMLKNMPFDEMKQSMVPVYQKHFTKGDIDALISFYSSPTGQKMLRELPAIMGEAMQSMMPIMRKYIETVKTRVQDEFAQAVKESEKKTD
jgi:uncharacterized protein